MGNLAVTQLDQMTQQNAALVEEGAAAAESLKGQAQQLVQAVSVFRLSHGERVVGDAAPAPAPTPAPAPAPVPGARGEQRPAPARPAPVAKPKARPVPARAAAPAAAAAAEPARATVAAGDDEWASF